MTCLQWWHVLTPGTMRGCDTHTIFWHAPMMSSSHVIHVNDPCAILVQRTKDITKFNSGVSWMWTFFLGMLESYEDPCFHVTFSALSAGSTSHSMFTVRVYSLPVHSVYNACTPLSRAIHSVVRRPQRGQHQWSSLKESKLDLTFQWSLALQCIYNWWDQSVKYRNNNWESECDPMWDVNWWVKWQGHVSTPDKHYLLISDAEGEILSSCLL